MGVRREEDGETADIISVINQGPFKRLHGCLVTRRTAPTKSRCHEGEAAQAVRAVLKLFHTIALAMVAVCWTIREAVSQGVVG